MERKNQPTIEIKLSKTGNPIPVIDGVHLHSSYNPQKEAETFVENYKTQLEEKRFILVLGLGFSYHVDQIFYQMKRYWEDDFKIVVIDPVAEIEKLLNENRELDYSDRVVTYCGYSVNELYGRRELVEFLSLKPTVIPHTASFNLHNEYYKGLMSYRSKYDLESISKNIENPELKKYLMENGSKSYFEFVNEVNSKNGKWNQWDYLLMALNSVSNPENRASRD